MALKRNFQSLDTFSMSSMTDVIFLLLIFFMVTSTIIFPSAIDVNLPESSEQTTVKPVTEVYIDRDYQMYIVADRNDSTNLLSIPKPVTEEQVRAETARCLGCGASIVDPNKCIGCGLCTTKCAFDAIHLNRDRPERSTMVKYEQKLPSLGKYALKRAIKIKFGKK